MNPSVASLSEDYSILRVVRSGGAGVTRRSRIAWLEIRWKQFQTQGALFFFVLFNNGSRFDCIGTISDRLQLDVLRK